MGIRPPQINQVDPLERYGKLMALKNAQMQGDVAERGMADNERLRALFANGTPTAEQVYAISPEKGMAYQRSMLEQRDKEASIGQHNAAAAKSNYDVEADKIQRVSSMLSVAKDQPSWDMVRRAIIIQHPQAATTMPEQYDPQFVQTQIAQGQTITQRLTDQRAQQQATETGRHNLATEGAQAGTLRETGRHNIATEAAATAAANAGRWTNDLERGVQVNMQTGETRPITTGGRPIQQAGKPLTEAQGRGQMFGTRAAESDVILKGLEEKISTTGLSLKQGIQDIPIVGAIPGAMGNALLSRNQQMVEQAQRNFVNAVLRQESGAVISPSEFQNAKKQYFPQPGDSKDVRDQKRANRASSIEGFRVMAGSAGERIDRARSGGGTDVSGRIGGIDPSKLSDAELKRELGL
jgi:hypothetical protein